jgi:hypothetical protein
VHATLAAPFTPAVLQRPLSVIASKTTPHTGSKEHPMITETQTRVIVLQLTDEMLTQLQPFMAGLDITTTPHREWAYLEIYEQGQFAGYTKVEQHRQRLTMRGEVYDALIARVNGALDYDVRWQPNEDEPDGFVERAGPGGSFC